MSVIRQSIVAVAEMGRISRIPECVISGTTAFPNSVFTDFANIGFGGSRNCAYRNSGHLEFRVSYNVGTRYAGILEFGNSVAL